jgi:hypothetical protein
MPLTARRPRHGNHEDWMFYRVVLQGHVAHGADMAEVKREFMRITALPSSVTDRLFGGMPKIIKRRVPEADAERIALTLRAIGAAATIERELETGPDASPEGPATLAPLGGTDTISFHDSPPVVAPVSSKMSRWPSFAWRWLPWLVASGVGLALVPVAAPIVDDWVRRARVVPAVIPKPASKVVASDVKPEIVAPKSENLHGPWRCTSQSTGRSNYWLYNADGTLGFYGESDFASGKPAIASADVPTRWTLQGDKLAWSYAGHQPKADAAIKVLDLSLMKFTYIDPSREAFSCRRP